MSAKPPDPLPMSSWRFAGLRFGLTEIRAAFFRLSLFPMLSFFVEDFRAGCCMPLSKKAC